MLQIIQYCKPTLWSSTVLWGLLSLAFSEYRLLLTPQLWKTVSSVLSEELEGGEAVKTQGLHCSESVRAVNAPLGAHIHWRAQLGWCPVILFTQLMGGIAEPLLTAVCTLLIQGCSKGEMKRTYFLQRPFLNFRLYATTPNWKYKVGMQIAYQNSRMNIREDSIITKSLRFG